VILAACKTFALTHAVFALPSLVSSDRPLLIVWTPAKDQDSVIARTGAMPGAEEALTEEEAKLGRRADCLD
jgi:hypothetical protein